MDNYKDAKPSDSEEEKEDIEPDEDKEDIEHQEEICSVQLSKVK